MSLIVSGTERRSIRVNLSKMALMSLSDQRSKKNPHKLESHQLWRHGEETFEIEPPRDFEGLREWFKENEVEGIVWHHPDGRMVKIKRRDFDLPWPIK